VLDVAVRPLSHVGRRPARHDQRTFAPVGLDAIPPTKPAIRDRDLTHIDEVWSSDITYMPIWSSEYVLTSRNDLALQWRFGASRGSGRQ
jgi:hypothetical protein